MKPFFKSIYYSTNQYDTEATKSAVEHFNRLVRYYKSKHFEARVIISHHSYSEGVWLEWKYDKDSLKEISHLDSILKSSKNDIHRQKINK